MFGVTRTGVNERKVVTEGSQSAGPHKVDGDGVHSAPFQMYYKPFGNTIFSIISSSGFPFKTNSFLELLFKAIIRNQILAARKMNCFNQNNLF